MEDDFLLALDRELSATVSKAKLQSDLAKTRNKLISNAVSSEAKIQLRSEYAHLSEELNKILWRPIASVALFSIQHCDNCASKHQTFISYMQRQESIQTKGIMRWIRMSKPISGLLTEVIKQVTITHICADCCAEHGFDITLGEVKFSRHSEAFSVSIDYVQEELL